MGSLCAKSAKAESMRLSLPVDPGAASLRPSNYVKTSRYTAANFLFKCTLEQFYNLSNVYFLAVVVLAILGTSTNLFESPYSAAGTLLGLVLVIGFTMAFEGYYDIKRHREDREVNARPAYRLRPGDGHLEQITWAEVRAGDLLKVHDRAQFPADILFVTSCAPGNKCYVETANIDGETNLKIKHVPKDLVERCIMPDQAASLRADLTHDAPNSFLNISGSMRVYDDRYTRTKEGYKDIPLETSNLLLRGSVLRNTPWILGIALYVGPETKVVQSSSDPPTKRSRIQKLINTIIIMILIVDLILISVSSLIEIYVYLPNSQFSYLQQDTANAFTFPPYVANACTFLILYSGLLPISLLFCATFSNFFQAMFIAWDLEMYHEESDTPAKCNTMELVQELGQVSYLFSDKTGTLTRNEMKLVGCTVLGKTYGVGSAYMDGKGVSSNSKLRDIFREVIDKLRRPDPAAAAARDANSGGAGEPDLERAKLMDFFMMLAVCHTVLVDTTTGVVQYNAEGPDEEALVAAAADVGVRLVATDNGLYTLNVDVSDESSAAREAQHAKAEALRERALAAAKKREAKRAAAAAAAAAGGGGSAGATGTARVGVFRGSLGFLSSWRKTPEAEEAGREEEGEEEGEAADELGDATCVVGGDSLTFQVLAVNQFNSTRKRMSVVCRGPDKRLLLLVKGADTVMFDLLEPTAAQEAQRGVLLRHLNAFANDGLRTLVMASRELAPAEYDAWKLEYDEASNQLGDRRAEMLAAVAERLEKGLTIVGASAIEDRLQDGVPETLVALREAGVKTWVLTGDKVETAINIAFSARLFTPEMELVQITSDEPQENLQTLRDLQRLMVPENLVVNSKKREEGRSKVKSRMVRSVKNAGKKAGRVVKAVTLQNLRRERSPTNEEEGSEGFAKGSTAGGSSSGGDKPPRRPSAPAPIPGSSNSSSSASTTLTAGSSGSAGGSLQSPAPPPVLGVQVSFAGALLGGGDDAGSLDDTSTVQTSSVADDTITVNPTNSATSQATTETTDSAPPRRSRADSARPKRPSIPFFSQFWAALRHDGRGSASGGTEEGTRPSGSSSIDGAVDWRKPDVPLPAGIEQGDARAVNETELMGNEKTLEGFEAPNLAIVVSGPALVSLLAAEKGTPESESLLLSIAKLCSVVVACRVSPKQKALLVRMVKNGVKMDDGSSPITMAIGDGANDVAMIQEARVGVGISGHEGRQAVNSSDFAIAQFRFLQELMLVHGRWNYRRSAAMVLFVFYCNIVFVLTAFCYNFYNKFSGSALYWVFLTTMYSYPTQTCIAVAACFNKDISRKTALEYPAMYISGRRNLHLDRSSVYEYVFKAFLHGFLICAITIMWGVPPNIDISAMGTMVYMACIWVCVTRCCLETYTWTRLSFGTVVFGYLFMPIFEPIYYGSDPSIYLRFGPTVLWSREAGYVYVCVALVTVMCLAYDVVAIYVRKEFFPSVVDIVIEIDRGFADDGKDATGQEKKSKLRQANKLFRKIAQPLTIPAQAISELLAAANLNHVRSADHRSGFVYDHPEDEQLKELLLSMIKMGRGLHSTSPRLVQGQATPGTENRAASAKSAPVPRPLVLIPTELEEAQGARAATAQETNSGGSEASTHVAIEMASRSTGSTGDSAATVAESPSRRAAPLTPRGAESEDAIPDDVEAAAAVAPPPIAPKFSLLRKPSQ